MDAQKTGSKYALIIGLPASFALCLMALPLSHFYPFAYILRLASLKIFWNPLAWLVIAITVVLSLWQNGKAISPLLKKHDVLKTSFYFTFFVNLKLMLVTAAIYFAGIFYDWIFNVREIFLPAIPYSIISMLGFFALLTGVLSVTISLMIVNFTRGKIEVNNNASASEVTPIEVNKE